MVGLWSPEPPPDSEDVDVNFSVQIAVGAGSDDELDDVFEGYQPLFDFEDVVSDTSSDSEREVGHNESPSELDVLDKNSTGGEQSRAASERGKSHLSEGQRLEHEQPGTSAGSSLGLDESRLEMGEQQVADVIAAMAAITLPASAFPPWANVVPEEEWKQEILERIRQIQNKAVNQN